MFGDLMDRLQCLMNSQRWFTEAVIPGSLSSWLRPH
jgi:hypothetical protein